MSERIKMFLTQNHLSLLDDTLTKIDIIFPADPRYLAFQEKYNSRTPVDGNSFKNGRIEIYTMIPGHTMNLSALELPKKIYFTLGNRIVDPKVVVGTDLPELMMVAVGIKREACIAANKGFGLVNDGSIPKLTVNINLTPNTEHVDEKDIVTLPYFGGCYEGLDGKLYYTQSLISR